MVQIYFFWNARQIFIVTKGSFKNKANLTAEKTYQKARNTSSIHKKGMNVNIFLEKEL